MLEMHLRHPRSTHTACGPFTKNKERIQKFKDTWDSIYIYQNKVDKTFFSMMLVMEILKTCPEKHYVIKHLKLVSTILH